MSKPMVRIHNIETGEIIDREMNDIELAEYQLVQAEYQERQEAQAQVAAKRAAALAKLEALGLDEDDLKALGL